jgi:hypothetical protein
MGSAGYSVIRMYRLWGLTTQVSLTYMTERLD